MCHLVLYQKNNNNVLSLYYYNVSPYITNLGINLYRVIKSDYLILRLIQIIGSRKPLILLCFLKSSVRILVPYRNSEILLFRFFFDFNMFSHYKYCKNIYTKNTNRIKIMLLRYNFKVYIGCRFVYITKYF